LEPIVHSISRCKVAFVSASLALFGVVLTCPAQSLAAEAAAGSPPTIPKRIVSLAPHATELLFSAGLGSRVIGVTEACDFPAEIKTLPRVSSSRGANIEAILALKPDLVVVWPSGNRADDIEALNRLGIRVHKSELSTLQSVFEELRTFQSWSGASDSHSIAAADTAKRALEQTAAQYRGAKNVRIFYQLGEGRLFTLSNQHLIGEALALCGAENVFGKLPIPAPEVSREAVFAAKPDAILLSDAKALARVRASWRTNRATNLPVEAVDGGRLHRPTLRTMGAIGEMCVTINKLRAQR
jgi:iron complex transport system substrate-binding protein